MNADGIERSAILLRALGENEAAEVFKRLDPREVKRLGAAIASLENVTRERLAEVLEAFCLDAEQYAAVNIGSGDYLRVVLNKALGDASAERLLQDILHGGGARDSLDALNWMDSHALAELIRNEHPQVITAIVAHLDRARAAEVIGHLPDALRHDVILRVATFEGMQPAALAELTDALSNLLSSDAFQSSRTDGVRAAAEILNLLTGAREQAAIDSVRQHDAELAQQIVDRMFVFDNLVDVDDIAIRRLLVDIDADVLVLALKGTRKEMREKFVRNMSQRAAELLIEDIETSRPVRVSQVEEAQRQIVAIARRLADEGEIAVQRRGDDAYV